MSAREIELPLPCKHCGARKTDHYRVLHRACARGGPLADACPSFHGARSAEADRATAYEPDTSTLELDQ